MLNEKCFNSSVSEYVYSSYDIREYMDNVFKFYYFMTKSSDVSPIVKDYISTLDSKKLVWFYHQMKEPIEFITDDDFMYFYLEQIVQHKFIDLSLELYLNYYIDKCYSDDVIKSEWIDILSKRYRKEIIDFEKQFYQNECN